MAGILCLLFCFVGANCVHFSFCGDIMTKKTRKLTQAALIAALYVALTYLQNFILPGTTSMAIQVRAAEALCVLALFTPSAVWGLTVGCLLFNLSYAHTLPLDFLVGTLASFLAAGGMYLTRKVTIFGYPLLAMLLPAVFNGLLIGWELSFYIGGGFWINAIYVAVGEMISLLTLGSFLYYTIRSRHLDAWLRSF